MPDDDGPVRGAALARRSTALFVWAFLVWFVLTWSPQPEQLVFGALLAAGVTVGLVRLGPVVPPWRLLQPRLLGRTAILLGASLAAVVRANLSLARRIWTPSRPMRSGMVVVPTTMRSDAELASTGLITSLIVDNQIVDLDRAHHLLQFHCVDVPGGTEAKVAAINGPTERRVRQLTRHS